VQNAKSRQRNLLDRAKLNHRWRITSSAFALRAMADMSVPIRPTWFCIVSLLIGELLKSDGGTICDASR
jgi:hypothetical protein